MSTLTKIIAIVAIGLGLSFLIVIFLVSPQLSSVNLVNADVRDKKVELATLNQQILAFKNAQADLAKATRKEDISNAIVPKEKLVLPVQDLESGAAKAKTVEILLIKEPDAATTSTSKKNQIVNVLNNVAGVSEVPVEITTTSDYAGLVKFVSYLEHLPHFMEVSKLSLTAETTTVGTDQTILNTGSIKGELEGVLFMKTPAPSASKAAPTATATSNANEKTSN